MGIKGFSTLQKRWIKERDDFQCQMKGCEHKEEIKVYHIIPRRYVFTQLHWGLRKINSPFNGIVLCSFFFEIIYLKEEKESHEKCLDFLKKVAKKSSLKFLRKKPYPYPYSYRALEQNDRNNLNHN